MNRREEMRIAVAQFHQCHPEVWELFVEFTLEKIHAGFGNYSAKAVIERVRWETNAGAKSPLLKIDAPSTKKGRRSSKKSSKARSASNRWLRRFSPTTPISTTSEDPS